MNSDTNKFCYSIETLFVLLDGSFTQMDVCTPKLDNNKDPQELTVPLKSPTTYKIDSPEAENVLPQYYKVMMKCLTLTTGHKIQVFKFNKEFYDWLTQAVSFFFYLLGTWLENLYKY